MEPSTEVCGSGSRSGITKNVEPDSDPGFYHGSVSRSCIVVTKDFSPKDPTLDLQNIQNRFCLEWSWK